MQCTEYIGQRLRNLFHLRTLWSQLIFFLFVPVTLLLFGSGLIASNYARRSYLSQWQEASLLRLERAAHYIDMRLAKPLDLVNLYASMARSSDPRIAAQVLDTLRELPGVVDVRLEDHVVSGQGPEPQGHHMMGGAMMPFDRAHLATITQPNYDQGTGGDAVSLIFHLLDPAGNPVGRLEIKISFDYLMEGIRGLGWRQIDMAALIDENGSHLMHISGNEKPSRPAAAADDPLERKILEALKTRSSGTLLGPGQPPQKVMGYHRLSTAPWTLLLKAQGKQVLAPIIRLQWLFFAGSLVLLLSIVLLIRTSVGRIVGSICMLSNAAHDVARGRYGDPMPVSSADEIGHLIASYNSMVEGLKERDLVRNTFGRYIDEDVARKLLSHPAAVKLGGNRRRVAILMSDIRGFTPLSETVSPETAIQLLNTYFGHMIEAVKVHQGIIVDFVGDALLAFFDPLESPIETAAARGVRCALDMQARMAQFNREMQTVGLAPMAMGIGVHVGAVVVGNIGSETRAKYGIVGAAVNLTQRIEGEAGGGQTVLSEACYELVAAYVDVDSPSRRNLKGVASPLNLYPVQRWNVQ